MKKLTNDVDTNSQIQISCHTKIKKFLAALETELPQLYLIYALFFWILCCQSFRRKHTGQTVTKIFNPFHVETAASFTIIAYHDI